MNSINDKKIPLFVRFVYTEWQNRFNPQYQFNSELISEKEIFYSFQVEEYSLEWHFVHIPDENIVYVNIQIDNDDGKKRSIGYFGEGTGFRKCPFNTLQSQSSMQYVMLWTVFGFWEQDGTDYFPDDLGYQSRDHTMLIDFLEFNLGNNITVPFTIKKKPGVICYSLQVLKNDQQISLKCIFREIFGIIAISIMQDDFTKPFNELLFQTSIKPQSFPVTSLKDLPGIESVLRWTLFLVACSGYQYPNITNV